MIKWKICNVYICSLHTRGKLTTPKKETEKDKNNKAQGIIPHLFSFKNKAVCKKQDHSFQSSIWVQIKNIVFNFDIVLKSVVGMQQSLPKPGINLDFSVCIMKRHQWYKLRIYVFYFGKWCQAIFALKYGIHESIH